MGGKSSFPTSGREVSSLAFTESVVEDAALVWLETLGYAVLCGFKGSVRCDCGQA